MAAFKYDYTSDESSDNESQPENSIGTLDLSARHLTSEGVTLYFKNFEETQEQRREELNTLILATNGIRTVTIDFSKFVNLKILDLSNNEISILPEGITDLPLTTLIIKKNKLTHTGLPKSFQKLVLLKVCHMSGNDLKRFPRQLLDAKNLEYLYIGSAKLTEVPREIDMLQK